MKKKKINVTFDLESNVNWEILEARMEQVIQDNFFGVENVEVLIFNR